jgi:hypothetical protein
MDLRTGRTDASKDAARAAGVPESDSAEGIRTDDRIPEGRFATGPFKDRVDKRTPGGQRVRVR